MCLRVCEREKRACMTIRPKLKRRPNELIHAKILWCEYLDILRLAIHGAFCLFVYYRAQAAFGPISLALLPLSQWLHSSFTVRRRRPMCGPIEARPWALCRSQIAHGLKVAGRWRQAFAGV